MAKIYKTSRGKPIDMERMQLANENVIAIGNAGTNAKGDLLGPGGKVIKSRNDVMKDYHKMNTPVASNSNDDKS